MAKFWRDFLYKQVELCKNCRMSAARFRLKVHFSFRKYPPRRWWQPKILYGVLKVWKSNFVPMCFLAKIALNLKKILELFPGFCRCQGRCGPVSIPPNTDSRCRPMVDLKICNWNFGPYPQEIWNGESGFCLIISRNRYGRFGVILVISACKLRHCGSKITLSADPCLSRHKIRTCARIRWGFRQRRRRHRGRWGCLRRRHSCQRPSARCAWPSAPVWCCTTTHRQSWFLYQTCWKGNTVSPKIDSNPYSSASPYKYWLNHS